MNNIGRNKTNWLIKQGCYFETKFDNIFNKETTYIYIDTNEGKCYVGLADLGEKASKVNFIYKHRLTKLNTVPNCGGCKPVVLGFNEKEQAWYGWTHRGYGKFYIGYQVVKDSICDCANHKYPFTCQTLDDCKMLAIDLVEELA